MSQEYEIYLKFEENQYINFDELPFFDKSHL